VQVISPALPREAGRTRLGRIFHDTLSGYLRGLTPHSRRFWLLVPLTGVLAGLAAVASVHWLHLVQQLGWGEPEDLLAGATAASWQRRLLTPVVGAVLLIATEWALRMPPSGHGTTHLIEAIWVRQGKVRLRWAFVHGILCLTVVGLGASLGREGALVYFGGAAGSWLGRRFQVDGDQLKLLVACGASAGLAAAYNTPIGGALFGLEVFLGGLALDLYGPLIFASVSATLISRALLYDHPSYVIPHYRLEHTSELLLYLLLGLVIGMLSALLVTTVEVSSRWAAALPRRVKRLMPLPALATVGAIGIVFPQVFGNGYYPVNEALAGRMPFVLLLVLPVIKLFASTLCASSGVPGALFTPSMYIGGLAGGAFGVAAHHLFPNVVGSTGGYVLVGMGAILAGSTHATLAAAIILFELTGSYDLILPLLSASVLATVVSRAITSESIYTAPLRRRGVRLPRIARPAWMQREGVRSLVRDDAARVPIDASLEAVLLELARLDEGDALYAVDASGRLCGMIPIDAVRDVLAEQPDLRLIVAADLVQTAPAVSIDASLWDVTRRALAEGTGRLPVLSPRDNNRFLGTISIREVLSAAAAGGGGMGSLSGALTR
jgi:CIC family chloride channel protein